MGIIKQAAGSIVMTIACASVMASTGFAEGGWQTTWSNIYPGSSSINNLASSCQICHRDTGGGNNFNPYGWKVRQNLNAGMSITNAIKGAEAFDSDMDPTGSSNLVEINADTQPGWTPGPNNTIWFKNGTSQMNQNPPAGTIGSLDPPCSGSLKTYCTAKAGLTCGPAMISATGAPSASANSGFVVTASPARSNKSGLGIYGYNGRANSPFQGGTLCFKTPVKRTTAVNSGGSAACDGVLSIDYNAFAHGLLGGNPAPQLLVPGNVIDAQFWARDSVATGSLVTNALEWTICP